MNPPESTRHCHGHEFGLASLPPTMRVSEMSGWIAWLPHSGDDGEGGLVVGPGGATGLVVAGPVGIGSGYGDVSAGYHQQTTHTSISYRCENLHRSFPRTFRPSNGYARLRLSIPAPRLLDVLALYLLEQLL